MNLNLRKLWPLILAVIFFLIPLTLAFVYPISFWLVTDNEPHGLANALNLAYRLADRQMYPAVGMAYHPGVTFYLMGWLALALTGHPLAVGGLDFFNTIIDHVEDYHKAIIYLGAFVGAAGVYFFARTAQTLVPVGVAIAGLLAWLVSTPASILMFMSPGFESFAILINGLFLAVLVPLAYERDINPSILVFAGCVGALAYLNKLSYVYIPTALGAAIFAKLVFCRAGWIRGTLLISLFVVTFASVVAATAFIIIGWSGFQDVLNYHWSVILGSGMYGTGDQVVVRGAEVWRAIVTMPGDKAFAMPIAIIGGAGLLVGGVATGIKKAQHVPIAVISIGTGVAALLAATIVMKHYDFHYTAGVSATLPACVVCCYLLAKARNYNVGFLHAAAAALAILLMADPVLANVTHFLDARSKNSHLTQADLEEISSLTAGSKRATYFTYKVPFSRFGEGFVLTFASVPRLTYDYLQNRRDVTNSMIAGLVTRDVGAYVIDKSYFRDAETVKHAANLDLLGPKPVRFSEGDRLIELRTVFLLISR